MITGCYLPAARDDLSTLGDDVFSMIIKKSYSEKVIKGSGDFVGVSQVDIKKVHDISVKLLTEKTSNELIKHFNQAGGHCSRPIIVEKVEEISCNVVKTWQLKNIGARFDTANWSSPSAKMVYKFQLENDIAKTVELKIIDVTEHRTINTR